MNSPFCVPILLIYELMYTCESIVAAVTSKMFWVITIHYAPVVHYVPMCGMYAVYSVCLINEFLCD